MNNTTRKFVINLGDADLLSYGGYFIFANDDKTNAEGEVLVIDNEDEQDNEKLFYTVYRFPLNRCSYINGILSDNPYRPDHPAWWDFCDHDLKNLSNYCGITKEKLIELFCSDDPIDRAVAYQAVGDYYGFTNLDMYPLKFNYRETKERYGEFAQ